MLVGLGLGGGSQLGLRRGVVDGLVDPGLLDRGPNLGCICRVVIPVVLPTADLAGEARCQGLPGAKRRDAKAAGRSALDRDFRGDRIARRGRTARPFWADAVTGVRNGWLGPPTGGCGGTALRRRTAPCVSNAKVAGLGRRPAAARLPRNPSRLRREPSPVQRCSRVNPAPMPGALAGANGPARRRRALERVTRKGGRRPSRVTRSALARELARLHTMATPEGSAGDSLRQLTLQRQPTPKLLTFKRQPRPDLAIFLGDHLGTTRHATT